MDIKDIMNFQREFDKKYKGRFEFYSEITDENISELEHLLVCLVGEIGELSNITKKITRGDYSLKDVKSMVDEEVVDSFIYIIKISNQLGLNLEKAYFEKMEINKNKFEKYLK